ncbi:unnamed protein product [Phaedon cochleariae]|uniref:Uncharacterized protein n=1 Tax=Phaedon cochleariae TaxID=80249 RepID=A0A9N9X318_PHACE|nr:unnamed protein product [Phaedon cochleariae]
MIYARALTEVFQNNEDPRNGTAILDRIVNRSYHSIQGYDVFIDGNGDAEGNFTVVALLDDKEMNGTLRMSMQPVGYFQYNSNGSIKAIALPEFRYFNSARPIQWVGGKRPRAEPKCGFYGQKVCRHSVFHAPTSSIVDVSEQSPKRAYTTIGLYKGNIVAIKYLHKRSVDLTRSIRKELKQGKGEMRTYWLAGDDPAQRMARIREELVGSNLFNSISSEINTRFRLIAEDLLNKAYKKIEQQLETLVKTTEVSLSCNIDDMEIRCLLKLLNFLEILKMQALPPEVIKIIQMTKSFCVHFDKINEEPLGDSLVASGCKIVDIVKCSKFSQELLSTENSSKDYFRAEYSFYFRNTWFVALPIHGTREMDLSQKQRMMHMRLRRIILAHNDMYTQQAQYERELLLRRDPDVRIKRPGNNVYTGYGDVGNVFFYYGVLTIRNSTAMKITMKTKRTKKI